MSGRIRIDIEPWPEEAEYYILRVFELQKELQPILRVCLRQGIENRHYNLVDMLHPRIEEIAEDIRDKCLTVLSHKPPRMTRPPRWVNVTRELLEQIDSILEHAELIHEYSQQGKRQNTRTCLINTITACRAIKELLITVPVRRNDIPVLFQEVITELDDE